MKGGGITNVEPKGWKLWERVTTGSVRAEEGSLPINECLSLPTTVGTDCSEYAWAVTLDRCQSGLDLGLGQ